MATRRSGIVVQGRRRKQVRVAHATVPMTGRLLGFSGHYSCICCVQMVHMHAVGAT